MYRTKQLIRVVTLVGITLASMTVSAHGIWFAERSDQLAVVYGIGADDLAMVRRAPLITGISAWDAMQEPVETSLRVTDYLVLVDTGQEPAIVAAVMNNGIWSRTADGEWFNAGRDEVPDAELAERTYKFAVHLRSPLSGPLDLLPGQDLQIVPDAAVLPDKMGTDLPLRVLYKGEPAVGAQIIADFVNDPDAEPMVIGEDGRAVIKVRNQGLNVIAAVYDSPSEDPGKTDKNENTATLSFVLPHEPE